LEKDDFTEAVGRVCEAAQRHQSMYPVLLRIGGFEVASFGVLVADVPWTAWMMTSFSDRVHSGERACALGS
jgi:hypothetical protein